VHPWQLALFPPQAQEDVWGADNATRMSSSYAPTGRARLAEGGYQLEGRWSFSSGCDHASWVLLGGIVTNDEGRPIDFCTFLLPNTDYVIDDVWDTVGLRGTGSDSYSVKDLFVPDAHAPARDVPDERREKGPIYPIGSTLLYASGFCSVTLGLGRRMLETYTALARGKHSRSAPTVMARNNSVQREVGLLEAKLSAARAFLHEAAGQVYDASATGTLDVDLRLRLRLATTYGMNEATDVSIATADPRRKQLDNLIHDEPERVAAHLRQWVTEDNK